jgi:hypothetical protein
MPGFALRARPIRSERSWSYSGGSDELWDIVADVDRYREWWPWLRQFEADGGLHVGGRWRCEVAPPVPYTVRFTLAFTEVDPGVHIGARVSGDIAGTASLDVADGHAADGSVSCGVHLESSLAAVHPLLRALGIVAGPMTRWGHDWVLDRGWEQFVRATSRGPRDGAT